MQSAAQNQSSRQTRLFQKSALHGKLSNIQMVGQVPKNAGEASDVSSVHPSPFQPSKQKRKKQIKLSTTCEPSRNQNNFPKVQTAGADQALKKQKDTNETSLMQYSNEEIKGNQLTGNFIPS